MFLLRNREVAIPVLAEITLKLPNCEHLGIAFLQQRNKTFVSTFTIFEIYLHKKVKHVNNMK